MAAASSLRTLLLPKEHGSWSLALEPLALGLLVAPSLPGAVLALAVMAGFFTRRPLKLGVTLPAVDPRWMEARRWAWRLGSVAVAAIVAVVLMANSASALWPLLLAVPFGAFFLWFDLRNEMREAEAELAGCTAFAVLPAAFATLAGWPPAHALGLAVIMLARSIPTVLAVRTFLRLGKGQPVGPALPLFAAAGAALALAGLTVRGLVPHAAPWLALLLLVRACFYTTPLRPDWPARRVGLIEMVAGAVFVAVLAIAYRL
ncbi:MAG: YwiC-like family protein [Opitutales bacterium]